MNKSVAKLLRALSLSLPFLFVLLEEDLFLVLNRRVSAPG